MYLAMHDALNAIVRKFRPYAFFGTDPSAHPIAAAAQAAHDVMNHIYPTRQAENDAELAFWLGQVPDGRSKTRGINLGMASAAAIINARANDNMLVSGEYALQDPLEPGDYRFVPPLEFVYRPAFGNSTPFAIGSGAEFLPGPPPPLTSWTYAISVNETKAFGRLNSRFRSQDQTNLAAWWLEFNEIQWGRIMRQLTETRQLGLLDAVRMFALANMANIDATVAVWYAKNYYDFWRPFHAIGLADTDGNPLTEADPNWVSEHIVPPLQEYPSAHAIQCQAIARTLQIDLRHGPRQLLDPVDHGAAVKPGPLVQPPEHRRQGVRGVADHGRVPLPLLGERRREHGPQGRREDCPHPAAAALTGDNA